MRVRRQISVSVLAHAPLAATAGNLGAPLRTAGLSALNAMVGTRRVVAKAIVVVLHVDATVTPRVRSLVTAAKTSRTTVDVWITSASFLKIAAVTAGGKQNFRCTSSTLVQKYLAISIPFRRGDSTTRLYVFTNARCATTSSLKVLMPQFKLPSHASSV